MRKLTLVVIFFAAMAWASGPATTTISDTLVNPDGSLTTGTITVVNPQTFTSADGYPVPRGTVATASITNGTFTIALVPNAGASPNGTSYEVTYRVGYSYLKEAWVVPSSATPINLAAVRALSPPIPGITISFSQLAPPANCTNLFPQWTGTQWTCSSSSGGGMANPMSATGDLIYGGAAGAASRLAGNVTASKLFLAQTGTGTASAAPAWSSIAAADLPLNISSSTTGNAATATALKTAPAQCTAGQYATGVGTDGTANCSQIGYGQLSGAPTLRYQVIQAAGASLAQEANLNLTGSGISCADDPGNGRTTCTVTSNPGTVTSVGLALPSIFAVSGSPVTGNGTLTAALATQSANQFFAGPASGTAAAPGFRSLVAADLPANISSSTSGNAASATALAAVPAQCTAGQYATGVAASGAANCAQVAFSQVTGTATTAQLPAMVGDAGSGGSAGIVPAPAAGDAAAGKYLRADGKWSTPSGGGSSPRLYVQTIVAAGDTVTDSCSGTGCDFVNGTYTFSAGSFCPSVGTVYHILTAGLLTTVASTGAGNAGADLYLGGSWIAGAQIYESAGLANLPWQNDAWITCTATGTSGAIEVTWIGAVETGTSANQGDADVMNPAHTATISVNTTGTVEIESRAHFNTGAGNTVTQRNMIVLAF